ncbi:hypothetical protein ACI6PS_11515 [Flavobacterium sp. PLA-1-15]|uniref:hypothetical protein n=1 Tax=Flavobacterium sp. PLA-1-15 TaxID=3380533 RepID=UPI003B7DB60E
MEDKELFHFFKTRSASFDEMPSDELWSKIQNAIEIPKKTSSATISKIVLLTTLSLAIVTAIVFLINKNKNQIIDHDPIHPNKLEIQPAIDSLEINTLRESTISLDSSQILEDTLKKRKVVIKKSNILLKDSTFSIENAVIVPLEMDSIQIIDSKILFDTMMIKPIIKKGRLLFETKQTLSKSEFDSFVEKVLKQTKRDFGSLIVIKAKGHKPFRHIIKLNDTTRIEDSMTKADSIYNIKK